MSDEKICFGWKQSFGCLVGGNAKLLDSMWMLIFNEFTLGLLIGKSVQLLWDIWQENSESVYSSHLFFTAKSQTEKKGGGGGSQADENSKGSAYFKQRPSSAKKVQMMEAQMNCFVKMRSRAPARSVSYWLQRQENKVVSIMHRGWKMYKWKKSKIKGKRCVRCTQKEYNEVGIKSSK